MSPSPHDPPGRPELPAIITPIFAEGCFECNSHAPVVTTPVHSIICAEAVSGLMRSSLVIGRRCRRRGLKCNTRPSPEDPLDAEETTVASPLSSTSASLASRLLLRFLAMIQTQVRRDSLRAVFISRQSPKARHTAIGAPIEPFEPICIRCSMLNSLPARANIMSGHSLNVE